MRSTLATSPLLRLLGEWTSPDADASGMDFAERLSMGLGALDAIRLQSALQAVRALPAEPTGRPAYPRPQLAEDLRRVRGVLANAIAQDPLALAKARLAAAAATPRLPGAAAKPADGQDAAYATFHERHLELQRQMDLMVGPLHAHVRESIARASPGLRQLAALDAAMAQVLAAREQALLPALPGLLKKRFQQLRRAAQESGDGGDWLEGFAADWRRALAAELDLRLAPTAALVAAHESDDLR